MFAIFHFITNRVCTVTCIIGVCTIINKAGKLCKIIDENKVDGYKIGFDKIMLESIDDINKSVDSVIYISMSLHKILFISYDILSGNKVIKKDKDGKVILINKNKLNQDYKNKINELSEKVKLYEKELNHIKTNNTEENTESTYSDVSEDEKSDSDNSNDENKKEFTLE